MTDKTDVMRAEFEAWASGEGSSFYGNVDLSRDDKGEYRDIEMYGAFLAYQAALQSPAVRELVEALEAYYSWDYNVQSAKINGESIYSFDDFRRMRMEASDKADKAITNFASIKEPK